MNSQVNYEGLSQNASEIRSSAQKLSSILANIESEMNKVNSSWESKAATEFYDKFKQLASKFESFEEATLSYAKFLDDAVTTYREADQRRSSRAQDYL